MEKKLKTILVYVNILFYQAVMNRVLNVKFGKIRDMKTTNLLTRKTLCKIDMVTIAVSTSSVINNCRKWSFCSTAKTKTKIKTKQTRNQTIQTRLENTLEQINFIKEHKPQRVKPDTVSGTNSIFYNFYTETYWNRSTTSTSKPHVDSCSSAQALTS